MVHFQFGIIGRIALQESLIGNWIIQEWAENCLCIVALHLFKRGRWTERSEECRAVQEHHSRVMKKAFYWVHVGKEKCIQLVDNDIDNLRFSVGKSTFSVCNPGNSSTRPSESSTNLFTSRATSARTEKEPGFTHSSEYFYFRCFCFWFMFWLKTKGPRKWDALSYLKRKPHPDDIVCSCLLGSSSLPLSLFPSNPVHARLGFTQGSRQDSAQLEVHHWSTLMLSSVPQCLFPWENSMSDTC